MTDYRREMLGVVNGWKAKMTELELQAKAFDITENEKAVFGKRETKAAQERLYELGTHFAGDIQRRMRSLDKTAADRYQADYWDPRNLDRSAIDHYTELYSRRIEEAGVPESVQEVIREAMGGPKEATFALWKCQPLLKGARDPRVRVLSEQARNALQKRLYADEGYQKAVLSQNKLYSELAEDVRTLQEFSRCELSPVDTIRVNGQPGSIQSLAYHFASDGNSVVEYEPEDLAAKKQARAEAGVFTADLDGIEPTYEVHPHIPRDKASGGILDSDGQPAAMNIKSGGPFVIGG